MKAIILFILISLVTSRGIFQKSSQVHHSTPSSRSLTGHQHKHDTQSYSYNLGQHHKTSNYQGIMPGDKPQLIQPRIQSVSRPQEIQHIHQSSAPKEVHIHQTSPPSVTHVVHSAPAREVHVFTDNTPSIFDRARNFMHLSSMLHYSHPVVHNGYVYAPPLLSYIPSSSATYTYFGQQTSAYAGYRWHTNDGTFKTNYVSSDPKFWTNYNRGQFYTPFFNTRYGSYQGVNCMECQYLGPTGRTENFIAIVVITSIIVGVLCCICSNAKEREEERVPNKFEQDAYEYNDINQIPHEEQNTMNMARAKDLGGGDFNYSYHNHETEPQLNQQEELIVHHHYEEEQQPMVHHDYVQEPTRIIYH